MTGRSKLSRWPILIVAFVIGLPVGAAENDGWLGRKFMPKEHCVPKVGNREILLPLLDLPFQVKRVEGHWLWVGRAWVKKVEVVPLHEAAAYYSECLRQNPSSSNAYFYRAAVSYESGDFQNAVLDWTEAIRLTPKGASAYSNRGNARCKTSRPEDALEDYAAAIRIQPRFAGAYFNRGCYWEDTVTWEQLRKFDNAIRDFGAAIRLDPKHVQAYFCRGNTWIELGENDKALADYTTAIQLGLENSRVYNNRAFIWMKTGEFDRALSDLEQAIRLEPQDGTAYCNRARIWASAADDKYRDGKRAVESATKACELSGWNDPEMFPVLAAAHAEAGNFEAAVKWQTRAIESAADDAIPGLKSRLDLYKSGKPYRDEPTK